MWSSDADSCLFWTWYGSGGADAAAQGGHADEVLQGNVFRNLKMRAGFPFCRYNGNSDGTAALPTDLSPDEDGAVVAGIPWAGHARMARVANMAVPLFMVSDADAFDTCTEVCNAQNRSCVDGDVMGSDGSATTCATTVSSGVNFWCNCGPYQ